MKNKREEIKQKSLGQNFLVHPPTIHKIVQLTLNQYNHLSTPPIVEIGPGKGALTYPLLDQIKDPTLFTLIEKDRKIAKDWRNLSRSKKFKIIEADFLDLSTEEWGRPDQESFIISNLPYSSSTVILNRLTQERFQINEMVLMFQKEVANRIKCKLGLRDVGSLTIWIQNLWEVKSIMDVPPQAFKPPPKIHSEVLHFKKRKKPLIENSNQLDAHLNKLLKICFKQPRKMIRSNLKAHPQGEALLEQTSIVDTHRPQHLSWKNWEELFAAYINLNSKVTLE